MADSTRKVALVTGGAKRVGRAIVEKLAREGFDIALTYSTSAEEAAEAVKSVQAMGRAALANLTVGLSKLLAPDVTVNGIAPGVVEWPSDYPPEQREKYLKRVPLGRAGTPQDVANLVHLLVGGGGDYITGQIIRLDGGRSVT